MNDLDWATVGLLRATSSEEALEHYYRAEWAGLPAYDVLPWWAKGLPRDGILRCASCGEPFPRRVGGVAQDYCSTTCRDRASKRSHWEANRERYNAAKRARRVAR